MTREKRIRHLSFTHALPSASSPAWIGEITRMARQASSKPDSGTSQSSATIGFERADRWQPSGARSTAKDSPQGERGGVHQFGVPPKTALRDSAFLQREASPQLVSEAKDNGRIYDPACGSGGSLPASRLFRVCFAEKDVAIAQGGVQSEIRSEATSSRPQRETQPSRRLRPRQMKEPHEEKRSQLQDLFRTLLHELMTAKTRVPTNAINI
jgi:hypothetical protein